MAASLCHFPPAVSSSSLFVGSKSRSLLLAVSPFKHFPAKFSVSASRPWTRSYAVSNDAAAAASVASPFDQSESPSLGKITRLDFPILHQVGDRCLVRPRVMASIPRRVLFKDKFRLCWIPIFFGNKTNYFVSGFSSWMFSKS